MTNYDKVYKVIPIPELNDLENLQIWWLKSAYFFPNIDPARCCYNARLIYLKNKSIFLTTSVFNTQIKVNRNKYKDYLSQKMSDEVALLFLLLFFRRSLVHEFPFSSEFSPKSKRSASFQYQTKKKRNYYKTIKLLLTGQYLLLVSLRFSLSIFVCFLAFILRLQCATNKNMWKLRTTKIQ